MDSNNRQGVYLNSGKIRNREGHSINPGEKFPGCMQEQKGAVKITPAGFTQNAINALVMYLPAF